MSPIEATEHGEQRADSRLGLGRTQTERLAQKAFERGLCAGDTAGSLRRYLDGVFLKHGKGQGFVWGEFVYVISSDKRLITVLNLPHELRRAAQKTLKLKALKDGTR